MNKPKNNKSVFKAVTAAAVILVFLTAAFFSYKAIQKNIYPIKYKEYIDKYSLQYGVPKDLLYATVKTESGFDEKAKSAAGAVGLTQITPQTLEWLTSKTGENYSEEDLYNPEIAIKYCAYFYSLLLNEFGNTPTAVAAYHAGRGQVNTWLADRRYSSDGGSLAEIPSSATRHYVNKITDAIKVYNHLYKGEL